MKKCNSQTKTLLFHLFAIIALCYTSCSSENFEEITPEVTEKPTPEEPENNATDPCSFVISEITAGSTKTIDCILDLKGETFTLPTDVKLDFDGGDIINGTLIFTGENSTIDGRLLSSKLEIEGSVKLKDPSFNFYAVRWNIIEGKTSTENALNNKNNINKAIKLVHKLGGKIFNINQIDAYFDVVEVFEDVNEEVQSSKAILIPSNFDFRMTDKTHLRVQPNNSPAYNLMSIYKGENIKISGGNLYGDRWEHDYSPVNDIRGNNRDTHDWGHVMVVSGGVNILIENIYLADGSGDSFIVNASRIRNTDGTPGNAIISKNVTIRNSVITTARRNNISLTDGDGILIENNQITDAALGDAIPGKYTSAGVAPRYGVDLEAWRVRTQNGELLEYERIENVTFRGNTFKNNFAGDIDLYTCSNVIIENNFFDGWIANIASHDITIRNNNMKARIGADGKPFPNAILLTSERKKPDGTNFNYNYTIHDNTIEGYSNGMILAGDSYTVYNNTLLGFKFGIGIGSMKNSTFTENKLDTDVANSVGYYSRGATIDNVVLTNESAVVTRHAMQFSKIEASPTTTDRHLKFVGGDFFSKGENTSTINESKNIEIRGTNFNTEIDIINSENINIIPSN